MAAHDFARLEALFLAALERPALERGAFLDEACADDPALRAEMDSLLAAHGDGRRADTGAALLDGLGGLRARLLGDVGAAPTRVGAGSGSYRLLELVGRGGMGEVYRAEREDGYRQEVAVKLVRPGPDGAALVRRFEIERQILAWLEHPNIAALLDGGVSDDGRPFLVMQYVRGEPITAFADAHRLTIPERLRLFRTVCEAVQFAHARLVVHRDLKPSNILVTGDGRVQLLDFGIAKLLDPTQDGIAQPETGDARLLTPDHAAPEQLTGAPVTTATDVYALGLLLHELLVGSLPFRAASFPERQRAVLDHEPPAPSAAIADHSRGDAEAVAAARRTRPRALAQRLRGDLDQIVRMALRREPERRYASAGQLADDVERFLAAQPVRARPDTLGYRARRFVLRNRVAVGALAVVALALLGGLGVSLSALARARAAEATARAEAATAGQVSDFLVQLFRAGTPDEARGDTVTARELLDRGAGRIAALDSQPEVQGRLLRTIGDAYEALGLLDPALAAAERGLALQRARGPAGRVDAARSEVELAGVLANRGDYARAGERAQAALAVLEGALPHDDTDRLRALSMLARARAQLGDLPAAQRALEEVVRATERARGPAHFDLYSPLNNLAIVQWEQGDFAAARALYARALAIVERERGADHPAVGHVLNNLALVHKALGDHAAAVAAHERALALRRRLLAVDHPDVAESLNNLGAVHLARGAHQRARAVLEEALTIRRRALGAAHPHTATTEVNLGTALAGLGDTAAARPLLARGLASLEASVGATHAMVAHPLLTLARLDAAAGARERAEARFRRALAIREATLDATHPDLVAARAAFATFLRAGGRAAAADSLASRTPAPRLAAARRR